MTAFVSPTRSSATRARAVRSAPARSPQTAMRDLLRMPAGSTPAAATRASARCACGGACPRCNSEPDAQQAAPPQTTSESASSRASDTTQRAGAPEIPKDLPCPTDDAPGTPTGTDLLFAVEHSAITPAHTDQLTAFRATWVAAGGTGDILVHGYASTDGPPAHNWMLSCNRTQAVQAELVRLGIPAVHISIVAHGPSTDFGSGAAANRHAIVSTSPASATSPSAFGTLTPQDDFAGRSTTRFGAGEIINLGFRSFPARPATDFGGLQWSKATGGGEVREATKAGDATFEAPATAGTVQLELRVASGATAGRIVSTHTITIVIPDGVSLTEVPGTAPSFLSPAGTIAVGTWGAGFQANVFVEPKHVSFKGVEFGEAAATAVVKPAGSFLTPVAGQVHPADNFGVGGGGNATTGTPLVPHDRVEASGLMPTGTASGSPTCGVSDFLWAIPWEFKVGRGPRTAFEAGFTAMHHATSTLSCDATIEKAGAGPFCRGIDGKTC